MLGRSSWMSYAPQGVKGTDDDDDDDFSFQHIIIMENVDSLLQRLHALGLV